MEIEQGAGRVLIHRYASVHDVGRILNPIIVEGQIRGGFAHGFGAAMFEELAYDEDGNFLSGTLLTIFVRPQRTYLLSTLRSRTNSPANPLGSKGMGDGSSMLAPVVMANAVADALGRDDVDLPLTLNEFGKWRMKGARREASAFSIVDPRRWMKQWHCLRNSVMTRYW